MVGEGWLGISGWLGITVYLVTPKFGEGYLPTFFSRKDQTVGYVDGWLGVFPGL